MHVCNAGLLLPLFVVALPMWRSLLWDVSVHWLSFVAKHLNLVYKTCPHKSQLHEVLKVCGLRLSEIAVQDS